MSSIIYVLKLPIFEFQWSSLLKYIVPGAAKTAL